MRYLAIDLGQKRTGLAVGDDATGLVSPVAVVEAAPGEEVVRRIEESIEEHQPDAVIVGLPLNMDGSEGDAAKGARGFGAVLAERCHLPVHYQDERLTSFAADQQMARSGRTHKQKKELRDALAAAQILRDFLDAGRR
jgi:putative Holliday junction resolvase